MKNSSTTSFRSQRPLTTPTPKWPSSLKSTCSSSRLRITCKGTSSWWGLRAPTKSVRTSRTPFLGCPLTMNEGSSRNSEAGRGWPPSSQASKSTRSNSLWWAARSRTESWLKSSTQWAPWLSTWKESGTHWKNTTSSSWSPSCLD